MKSCVRRIGALSVVLSITSLQACHKAEIPLAVDQLVAVAGYRVKVYFHTTEAQLDAEKNTFSCVSGDGAPSRFYQGRTSGVETAGQIEFIRKTNNGYYYVSNMSVSFYDKEKNSWNSADHRRVVNVLKTNRTISCRVLTYHYFQGAPDLSAKVELPAEQFLRYYAE